MPQFRALIASTTVADIEDPYSDKSEKRGCFLTPVEVELYTSLELYILQQIYALMTYGQMSYFAIPPLLFNFQKATGSGPSIEDLTDSE